MSDPHAATDKLTHVLFMEPDLQARQPLTKLLRELDYLPHWASDPTQARQLLSIHPIELIIVDIVSGPSDQESGFEFALWIREQSPYAYVDLLFVSKDYPARLYRETSLLRYQALEYLDKPIAEDAWRKLLLAFQVGELLAPTSAAELNPEQADHAHITMAPSLVNDAAEILDPDEWANAIFAAKQASQHCQEEPQDEATLDTPPQRDPLAAYPHSEQDLPSFEDQTEPGRPITESRALAALLQQQAEQLAIESQRQPHTPPPGPHPAPQYMTAADTERQPVPMPNTTPLRPRVQHNKGPYAQYLQGKDDPEREKPTQSLPGFVATPQKAPGSTKQQAQQAFAIGVAALQKQQLGEALEALYHAAHLHPTPRHNAYFGWVLALSHGHDPTQLQRAETMLQQAAEDAPTLEQTHYLLGRFYQRQQRLQEAVSVYQKALSINPQYQEIYREYRLLQLQMTR